MQKQEAQKVQISPLTMIYLYRNKGDINLLLTIKLGRISNSSMSFSSKQLYNSFRQTQIKDEASMC